MSQRAEEWIKIAVQEYHYDKGTRGEKKEGAAKRNVEDCREGKEIDGIQHME